VEDGPRAATKRWSSCLLANHGNYVFFAIEEVNTGQDAQEYDKKL
jgi:hypothetical protein